MKMKDIFTAHTILLQVIFFIIWFVLNRTQNWQWNYKWVNLISQTDSFIQFILVGTLAIILVTSKNLFQNSFIYQNFLSIILNTTLEHFKINKTLSMMLNYLPGLMAHPINLFLLIEKLLSLTMFLLNLTIG
jgi:hypothetical protein